MNVKNSDLLNDYLNIGSTKSGFLMSGGKCVYLYNNLCCDAICRRVLMKADKVEILAEYADELLFFRDGASLKAYKGGKRILKISELIVLYEIPSKDGGLCGVFAYEKDQRLMDTHFTDLRILEFINSLIGGKQCEDPVLNEKFRELEEAVRTGEVSALNKIYLNGKNIGEGVDI